MIQGKRLKGWFVFFARSAAWPCAAGLVVLSALGQPPDTLDALPDAELGHELDGAWKYQPGDDLAWAAPEFNDHTWPAVATSLDPGDPPWEGWDGVGWFRYRFTAEPALEGVALALVLRRAGRATVYLDGEPVGGEDLPVVVLTPRDEHLVAVRYALDSISRLHLANYAAGFELHFEPASEATRERTRYRSAVRGLQMLFTGLPLAIGLVHLVLFLHLPSARANLFYAVLLLFWAATPFFDYQSNLASSGVEGLAFLRLQRLVWIARDLLLLRFAYAIFCDALPRRFYFFVALELAAGSFAVLQPTTLHPFLIGAGLVIAVEIVRILAGAVRERVSGAWLFAVGFASLFLFGAYDMALDLGLIDPVAGVNNTYFLGYISFFICSSVFLARDFARTHRQTLRQELELGMLEAENRRKSEELEAARDLQLSMLPCNLPELPHLDVVFDMRTASEVGGDYYDCHLAEDGAFTVVVGDATGHGMQAGTVVTSVKSLFNALGGKLEVPAFLERSSAVVREMKFGRLLMALAAVRIDGRDLHLATAGTPPVLIYRAQTGEVEEVHGGGLPLGARLAAPYREIRRELSPGDALLLTTDGFAELVNGEGEMLGYEEVRRIFGAAAGGTSAEIVTALHAAGDAWRGGAPLADDVTFAVLKLEEFA